MGQGHRRQTQSAANAAERLGEFLEADHFVHRDLTIDREPIELRAQPMDAGAHFSAPGIRRILMGISEGRFDPFAKIALLAGFLAQKQLRRLGPALFALVVVVRQNPGVRIPDDGKLVVALELLRSDLGRVAGQVFVVFPLDAKDAIHTITCRLRDMDVNAA